MSGDGTVRTTCPYCGVGCGLRVAADGTTNGTIAGDPDHPANRGRLCSKGAALGETLGDTGRLLYPTIAGCRASWDEALDLIAGRFAETIAAHGPDSVALYVSGQFLTEDYYVANKLMKGFVGSGNIDTNSRLCMASSVAGHVRGVWRGHRSRLATTTWKRPTSSSSSAAIWPGATRSSTSASSPPGRSAGPVSSSSTRAAPRPAKTPICAPGAAPRQRRRHFRRAPLASSSSRDAASCSTDWVSRRTTGLDAAVAAAPPLAAASQLANIPIGDLARFYDWFGATERCVTIYSQGVNQSASGTDKVNAIVNCHLATGRIGRPGMRSRCR